MITTFYTWFKKGAPGGKPGYRSLLSGRLFLLILLSLGLTLSMNADPFSFAAKALFPAASILVSMAVAWTSRASTVLNDETFRRSVISDDRPLEDYVYGYQLSLLIIISMVAYVAIMAGGGLKFVLVSHEFSIFVSGFFLYFFLTLAVSECWSVIDFSNLLSILHSKIPKK